VANVYSEDQLRGDRAAKGYLDMISISIPQKLQSSSLTSIEVLDTSLDPSLVIYGITVTTNK